VAAAPAASVAERFHIFMSKGMNGKQAWFSTGEVQTTTGLEMKPTIVSALLMR